MEIYLFILGSFGGTKLKSDRFGMEISIKMVGIW